MKRSINHGVKEISKQHIKIVENELQNVQSKLVSYEKKIISLQTENSNLTQKLQIPLVSRAHEFASNNFGQQKWINSIFNMHILYLLKAVFTVLNNI